MTATTELLFYCTTKRKQYLLLLYLTNNKYIDQQSLPFYTFYAITMDHINLTDLKHFIELVGVEKVRQLANDLLITSTSGQFALVRGDWRPEFTQEDAQRQMCDTLNLVYSSDQDNIHMRICRAIIEQLIKLAPKLIPSLDDFKNDGVLVSTSELYLLQERIKYQQQRMDQIDQRQQKLQQQLEYQDQVLERMEQNQKVREKNDRNCQ